MVRHGETDLTPTGPHAGSSDVGVAAEARDQATWPRSWVQCVLHGPTEVLVSSPRCEATETAVRLLLPPTDVPGGTPAPTSETFRTDRGRR